MDKYKLNDISKLLEKVFTAGFTNEKSILNIQLDDLTKIKDITAMEIAMILELKKAIKNKQIIAFLSSSYERKEEKTNERI